MLQIVGIIVGVGLFWKFIINSKVAVIAKNGDTSGTGGQALAPAPGEVNPASTQVVKVDPTSLVKVGVGYNSGILINPVSAQSKLSMNPTTENVVYQSPGTVGSVIGGDGTVYPVYNNTLQDNSNITPYSTKPEPSYSNSMKPLESLIDAQYTNGYFN